jgi:hypothetical protein
MKKNFDEIAYIWGIAGLLILIFMLTMGVDSLEKLIS